MLNKLKKEWKNVITLFVLVMAINLIVITDGPDSLLIRFSVAGSFLGMWVVIVVYRFRQMDNEQDGE